MKKSTKKGFTIVELVIVIAVIAILAAVLIPTFISLTKKANQSADIQAVNQMNKQLAISNAETPITNVYDAVRALDKVNIDLENYKALASDHYFYFVVDKNNVPMVIYVDANDNVLYPEGADVVGLQWMSLSGEVPMDDSWEIQNHTVTIDSGAKLASLMEAKKGTDSSPLTEELTITLSGNVDLKGAAVDFGYTTGNITITGENGATLSGIRADNNTVSPTTGEHMGHKYGFGLLGKVASGTVTIKGVTISSLSVGNTNATHESGANTIGLVAGYISAGATVKLENVTFKDCTVNGYQKVGGIVGQLNGTLDMKSVKFENVIVKGVLEVAKVIGVVTADQDENNFGKFTFDSNCNFDGISVVGLDGDISGRFTFAEVKAAWGENLKGQTTNTYGYWQGWYGTSNKSNNNFKYVVVFGLATNDLAWYYRTKATTEDVTIKGENYSMNRWVCSTSEQITDNGAPASN